jgi:dienelactone hydrolase
MKEQTVIYTDENVSCEGFLVYDDSVKTPQPIVLVAHAWRGQDDFARNKAKELAKLGYAAFAIDMFGNKKNSSSDQESAELIKPFFKDRALLQRRVFAGFDTVYNLPFIDKSRIGAIGFCFGGLTVLELLRSGKPVKAIVSFHGALSSVGAKQVPIAQNIQGSALILHGFDDPLVTPDDVLHVQTELNNAGVKWQMNIYGHTAHAFTNPIAKDPSAGMIYNEKIAKRSWNEMKVFFEEIL